MFFLCVHLFYNEPLILINKFMITSYIFSNLWIIRVSNMSRKIAAATLKRKNSDIYPMFSSIRFFKLFFQLFVLFHKIYTVYFVSSSKIVVFFNTNILFRTVLYPREFFRNIKYCIS